MKQLNNAGVGGQAIATLFTNNTQLDVFNHCCEGKAFTCTEYETLRGIGYAFVGPGSVVVMFLSAWYFMVWARNGCSCIWVHRCIFGKPKEKKESRLVRPQTPGGNKTIHPSPADSH